MDDTAVNKVRFCSLVLFHIFAFNYENQKHTFYFPFSSDVFGFLHEGNNR